MNHDRADEELASLAASKLVLFVQDVEGIELTGTGSTLCNTISQTRSKILVCDAGYGFPREARPRKEKLLAIARQLANFLQWQQQQQQEQHANDAQALALVQVVGCTDESIRSALEVRTLELLQQDRLPAHVEFSCQPLEEYCRSFTAVNSEVGVSLGEESTLGHDNGNTFESPHKNTAVYLSPDTDTSLDSNQPPPNVMIIGLLVDRKVQRNRSKDRATALQITQKRLPLEEFSLVEEEEDVDNNANNTNSKNNQSDHPAPATTIALDRHEPLNIDCILEVIQQWWWNCAQVQDDTGTTTRPEGEGQNNNDDYNGIISSNQLHPRSSLLHECFVQATAQAMEHHSQRHPARPIHNTTTFERK
jgi:hypothetical protein